MAIGLIGQKCGMTRVFTDEGVSIPVTAIKVDKNRVTQIKTEATDGYIAVQLAAGSKKISRTNKPAIGHFAKAKVESARCVKEFRATAEEVEGLSLGDEISLTVFRVGQQVDVTADSKGKGFAGTIKRHNFSMGDATHGNSKAHRSAGSIGQNQDPGKVFKGKKMAGHLGNCRTTVQSLEVVKIDENKGLVLIKGGVPGATGANVLIKPAVKLRAAAEGGTDAS